MPRGDLYNRTVVLAIGLLVVLAPMVIIFFTLSFLSLTGDLVVGRLTLLEFLELYVLDLVLFGAFAYGLYRLTLRLIGTELPASLDALELGDGEETEGVEAAEDRD